MVVEWYLSLVGVLLVSETCPLAVFLRPFERVYHLLVLDLVQTPALFGFHVARLHRLLSQEHLACSPQDRMQILFFTMGSAQNV